MFTRHSYGIISFQKEVTVKREEGALVSANLSPDDEHNLTSNNDDYSFKEAEVEPEPIDNQSLMPHNDQDHAHIDNGVGRASDEFILFGNFVATGMQNIHTAEFRRKFKNGVRKLLLDVMIEEESVMFA